MQYLTPPYKRNIKKKLFAARTIFTLSIVAVIILVLAGLGDYAILVLSVLAFGVIFPIEDLYIDHNTLTIRHYFIYGLLARITNFSKQDNIQLTPFEIKIRNANVDVGTDAILAPLVRKYYLLTTEEYPGIITRAKLRLSNPEFALINQLFNIDRPNPQMNSDSALSRSE
jgi:hypothetical protein